MNDDVLSAFAGVIDPALGINIVDLGPVYRAARIGDVVAVRMTMTTTSCPQRRSARVQPAEPMPTMMSSKLPAAAVRRR